MTMQTPAYLSMMIRMNAMFEKRKPRLPETKEEIMGYLDALECHLSPENLTCDGELSREEVQRKRRGIMESQKYLMNLLNKLS